jgi:hypothetical protein
MPISTKVKIKNQKLSSVHKSNLVDTLMVFAYFIAPDSLFFEFIENLKNIKCKNCDADVGTDLIFRVIRQFGGTNIKIPTYTEIETYKFLITQSGFCANFLKSRSVNALITHIKEMLDVPPEVDIAPIVNKFCEVTCLKERTICKKK